jgi:TrmH family RNA methyltransferase
MPCVILVNPYLDQNVGSCARAMLNFGLTELRVVDPRCDIRSESAIALAAGAADLLHDAVIYPTVKECIQDLTSVMATTIRPRDMSQVIYTPSAAAEYIWQQDHKIGIMFGRERSGLSNDEIALSDSIITIPSMPQFSSLNLAQAVNIVGYEIWTKYLDMKGSAPPKECLRPKLSGSKIATRDYIDGFLSRLEKGLDNRVGEEHKVDARRRELHYIDIRNIFQRVC